MLMNKVIAGLIACGTVIALSSQAAEKEVMTTKPGGGVAAGQIVKVTATVEDIDQTTREVTLKGPEGHSVTITAGPRVKNLAQVQVGDKVNVAYYESLSLQLLKTSEKGSARSGSTESLVTAPAGAKPGGMETKTTTLVAVVDDINTKKRVVTLKGPMGRLVDVKVQDPNRLKNVKVGDEVEAVYTQAMAVTVTGANKK
jgi:Cu/Ag efflux protein CusF